MKGLLKLFVCPKCHHQLDLETESPKCDCGATYHKKGNAIDFRVILEDKERSWDSEAFDKAYEKADSGFEDGTTHALNAGIPEFAEKYRQSQKGALLKEFVSSRQPERLLDLGCGCGWFCYELAELSPDTLYYGIDISPFRINVFKGQIEKTGMDERMECALANGEDLPFPDSSFDIVVMREVLEHVQDPLKTMTEINRILIDDGYLLITTPTKLMTVFWETMAFIPTLIKRLIKREPLLKKNSENVYDSPLSCAEIKKIIKEAGYKTVKWEKVIFLPHESYLQFIPEKILRIIIKMALLIKKAACFQFLGLHHVIFLNK